MILATTHRIGFHAHCLDCDANLTAALDNPLLRGRMRHGDPLCEVATEHGGQVFYQPGDHNTSPQCKSI